MEKILSGQKNICNFVGRSWRTVEGWIINHGFPAKKLNGIWMSNTDLIADWHREMIGKSQERKG